MSENGVIDAEHAETPARNGSRFNAVKHGLFAKSAVLPGEDLEEFQARVEIYREGLNPRSELQEDLARKAALASWQHERAVLAEQSRAESELKALEDAASGEQLEALKLGSRLLFDRRGATEMYASREYCSKQPKTSFSNDPCDPDQPERLILQLEQTVAGCRLLLRHWGELRGLLERPGGWQSREKLVVSRLLGMQPMNVVHKPELAKIFLACHVIEPQFNSPFRELRCELDENSYNRYQACLSRRDVEALMPADATAARAFLLKVVDDATLRLRAIEARLQKKSEASRARERNLIALGISKTGEQIRRAQASFNRLLLRNVDAVRKVQREDDRGWEVVRKAREERKALRQEKNKRIDPQESDLASADHYGAEMEEMQRRAEARVEREIAAEQAEAERARAKLQNEAVTAAVRPDDDVTLIVTGTGARENIRNEIADEQVALGEEVELLPEEELEREEDEIWRSGDGGEEEGILGSEPARRGPRDMVDESIMRLGFGAGAGAGAGLSLRLGLGAGAPSIAIPT